MTVVDFRSGGYDDARESYGRGGPDASYRPHEWDAEDWDDAQRTLDADAGRLSDRDSVLGRVARLTHYLGALVSVVLMIALMVWGYQLVVRDVSGVPVIRAVEGEARIAPDEPGGMLNSREGLSVNTVAAGGEPAPVERVAIAPAATALDGQDVAMGELGATAREAAAIDEADPEVGALAIAQSDAEAARLAEIEAEAAAQPTGVPAVAPGETDSVPVAAAVTDTNGQPAMDTAITAALAEAGAVPPVAASTRPMPRPRRIAAASAPAAAASVAPAVAAENPVVAEAADAAPAQVQVPPGAPLVQIGAFDSDAIAGSEWSRVSGRYADLFAGKAPVVQQHKAGGRTFYRLRIAGFESREEARKFCAALIAAGNDCIPAAAQ